MSESLKELKDALLKHYLETSDVIPFEIDRRDGGSESYKL